MNHLSHDELIDHIYGEGAQGAADHLKACAACADAHRALKADLAEIPTPTAEEPDAAYEERLWNAISPQLVPYPQRRRIWLRPALWLSLSVAGACAALIVAAFYAGRVWEHGHQPRITASISPAPPQKKIVVVLLSDHLERSERLLLQLKHANADDTAMLVPIRDEARSLLATNRMCREEAEKAGDPGMTAALDRLNQLLTQLADQPGGLNAAAISKLQDEMNAEGLLLEVRVLRSRLPERGHLKGGMA
jgi:anti-sigma-K factor RskA